MSDHLEKRLDNHDYEIRELRDNIKELVGTVKDFTSSTNNLANSFAVYSTKHDVTQDDIRELKELSKEHSTILQLHSNEFAALRPFTDALRGLIWKIVGATFTVAIGVATAAGTVVYFLSKSS